MVRPETCLLAFGVVCAAAGGATARAIMAHPTRATFVAARALTAGNVLTEDMIDIKRPGNGLPPSGRPNLVVRTMRVDITEDTLFCLDMFG